MQRIKKVLAIIVSILLALLFATPYILFRSQIQQMSLWGYLGLILACVISNASIFLPSSSTLIVVVASFTLNPLLCILSGALGTAIGEQTSYICGRIGAYSYKGKKELKQSGRVSEWLARNEALTIFTFAFIPLPIFDIVGIVAGAKKVSWIKYSFAAVLGKALKFCFAVICVYYFLPWLESVSPSPLKELIGNFLNNYLYNYNS